ncbi:MAG: hypothetical protein AAGC49_06510 [Brevundimonas sp.]
MTNPPDGGATHRPAAPAFVLAIVLVGAGCLLSAFFLVGARSVGLMGLFALAGGVVAALVGLLRLAIGVDYLTFREQEREAGRDFVLDRTSDVSEERQRAAAMAGVPALSHEARMARIREAVDRTGP